MSTTGSLSVVQSDVLSDVLPASRASRPRRFHAPEVIQTSVMDCGPAVLSSLLGGFGIPVHHGRLREACQTALDGTSIDTLARVARAFGLDAVETVLPADHLLLGEARALPAIVVVNRPGSGNHFALLWRRLGRQVQVMDPAAGRRWMRWEDLEGTLYRHTARVPVGAWLGWAASPLFVGPLERRLRAVGVSNNQSRALIDEARGRGTWLGWAALDAATRFWDQLRRAGLTGGVTGAARVIRQLTESAQVEGEARYRLLPRHLWTARLDPTAELVETTGVLVVSAHTNSRAAAIAAPSLPPALALAAEQATDTPESALAGLLRHERRHRLGLVGLGVLVGTGALLVQTLLFRQVFDLAADLGLGAQRSLAMLALLAFLAALGLLDLTVTAAVLRLGRVLETRLRVAFLSKIPRLGDLYLASRLRSDMAERSHTMHLVRTLPTLIFSGARALTGLVLTTAGIALVDPRLAPWALLLVLASTVVPFIFRRRMTEHDLKARTQIGGLARHHLDALVGATPLRTHGADGALRREHETLLVAWVRSGRALIRSILAMRTTSGLIGAGLTVLLLLEHHRDRAGSGAVLLLAYWVMSLPDLANQFATAIQRYPSCRNIALRCLEPLGAPESPEAEAPASPGSGGMGVALEKVTVEVAGHRILEDVELKVAPGKHVAIIGRSGAGKSTLLGLLLGWHQSARGRTLLDGQDLAGADLEPLRAQTAWVDPAVQLWKGSLLENLLYGSRDVGGDQIARALEAAELRSVVERLPHGLQSPLGEGGALLSGGEGQRVRFGRALLRPNVRLALLDEPFRGLDRPTRRRLLARAREHFRGATLLCVTHDLEETRGFDEVVVIEDGRIVEQGAPAALLTSGRSRYSRLLAGEYQAGQQLWGGGSWRRLHVEGGKVQEPGARP